MGIKQTIADAITPACAALVRSGPDWARQTVWSRVCDPYLFWREGVFEVETKYGFRFQGDSADLVPRYIRYFGVWEPAISQIVASLPLEGRTFIDIGANLGWYSLLTSRCVGATGRVVAIEASPDIFADFQRNLTLNGCRNVRAVNQAVWREESEITLYSGPSHNSSMTTVSAEFAESSGGRATGHTIPARPLGMILTEEEIRTAGLVKIDVEGAEAEVMEGMMDVLDRFPQDVKFLMEITEDEASNRIVETFRSRGFRMFIIDNVYSPEFYLDTPEQKLVEFHGEISGQVDVIISRAALR